MFGYTVESEKRVYDPNVDHQGEAMHPALNEQAHRPWPIPATPWTWRQSWRDLLFAHWALPVEAIRPLVPTILDIDTFEGRTYVGVVPFRMEGVTRRPFPPMPWLSAFPELNVRLYVRHRDKPGVFFLSLDADNPVAVWAARTFFRLPYFWSKMQLTGDTAQGFHYVSQRRMGTQAAKFVAQYRPTGEPFTAPKGSLEAFLVERYCLYTVDRRGRLLRGEVHHAPWPLQHADATIDAGELLATHGLNVANAAPHLLFTPGVDVVLWGLVRA